MAIDDARRSNKQLCVAWLDLKNAFGSVPHDHIYEVAAAMNMPQHMIQVIQDLYNGATTRGLSAEGLSEPIHIMAGVKQGCPLSPVLFNIAIEPLLRSIREQRMNSSYKLAGGIRIQLLAYADDLCLLTSSPASLQDLLDKVGTAASHCGLTFKPAKCATLHQDCRKGRRVIDTVFSIQGGAPAVLQDGETYRHLGVPTGFRANQNPTETIDQMERDIRLIDDSLLAPWQKIDTISTFITPRLEFILRGGYLQKGVFQPLDQLLKKSAKKWFYLPRRASAEVVYLLPSQGGAGLIPIQIGADIATINQAYRMLTCQNKFVMEVAWSCLEKVVRRKVGRLTTKMDCASYLNGASAGEFSRDGGDIRSIWSRARRATLELAKNTNISWTWNETRKEIEICVPAPKRTWSEYIHLHVITSLVTIQS